MKTLEEIKTVIEEYDKLITLVKEKIAQLEMLDGKKYDIGRYIDEIDLDAKSGKVNVRCYNDYMSGFSFPLSFLIMTNDELNKTVVQERNDRLEQKRIELEQAELKAKETKEAKERALYESLKAKFEK